MRIHLVLSLAAACAVQGFAADGYQPVLDDSRRPMLGIEMTPVPTHILDREGLTPGQGVLVQGVFSETAAAQMGLNKGDIILGVNGQPIGSMTDLRNEVGLSQSGDAVEVAVRRNGETVTMKSDLKPWPAHIPYTPLDAAAEKRFRDWQDRRQGRLADDARALRDQINDLKRQFDPAAEPPGPGQAGLPDAGTGLPAFRISLRVPAGPLAASEAEAVEAGPEDALRDPTGGSRAWVGRVRVNAAPRP